MIFFLVRFQRWTWIIWKDRKWIQLFHTFWFETIIIPRCLRCRYETPYKIETTRFPPSPQQLLSANFDLSLGVLYIDTLDTLSVEDSSITLPFLKKIGIDIYSLFGCLSRYPSMYGLLFSDGLLWDSESCHAMFTQKWCKIKLHGIT